MYLHAEGLTDDHFDFGSTVSSPLGRVTLVPELGRKTPSSIFRYPPASRRALNDVPLHQYHLRLHKNKTD